MVGACKIDDGEFVRIDEGVAQLDGESEATPKVLLPFNPPLFPSMRMR